MKAEKEQKKERKHTTASSYAQTEYSISLISQEHLRHCSGNDLADVIAVEFRNVFPLISQRLHDKFHICPHAIFCFVLPKHTLQDGIQKHTCCVNLLQIPYSTLEVLIAGKT